MNDLRERLTVNQISQNLNDASQQTRINAGFRSSIKKSRLPGAQAQEP